MNNQKLAFIICVNNETYFAECEYYIRHLNIPSGYAIDVLGIREATSMCAAYNLGMQSTDARYKVYLHQDVFIRNRNFINDILHIFKEHDEVGMIGMVGGIGMPKTGVTYLAWNAGIVDCREPDMAYRLICAPDTTQDVMVDAVDGLLIATQYDVWWREDLFHNFDFYDVSQSFEMKRKGYQILVPYQKEPWVIHDSSFAKLDHYDENRKICLKEYPKYFTEDDGFGFTYHVEWEALSEELAGEIERLMTAGDWESIAAMLQVYRKNVMKNSRLETYGIMSDIYQAEKENNHVSEFFAQSFFCGCNSYEQAYGKYSTTRLLLRRMELGMPEEDYAQLTDAISVGKISCEALLLMVLYGVLDKKSVVQKLEECYRQQAAEAGAGQKYAKACANRMQAMGEALVDKPVAFAYSKRINKLI